MGDSPISISVVPNPAKNTTSGCCPSQECELNGCNLFQAVSQRAVGLVAAKNWKDKTL